MIAAGPDLLRLIAVPAFAWAALSDHHTRRVEPKLWTLLIFIGIIASSWEILFWLAPAEEYSRVVQLAFVPPLIGSFAAMLHATGQFGGADVKAVFTLSLLFPATINYQIPFTDIFLPLFGNPMGITIITIIINSAMIAFLYPLVMWYKNIQHRELSLSMIDTVIKPVPELIDTSGILRFTAGDGERHFLDLDTLRMYLRWRDINIEEISESTDYLRDPLSITDTYKIDDGAMKFDGGNNIATEPMDTQADDFGEEMPDVCTTKIDKEDTWGADRFFENIDHDGYGATPEDLRNGLDHIAKEEKVTVLPAFPLIVPLFFGLLLTLTVGDLATAWLVIS